MKTSHKTLPLLVLTLLLALTTRSFAQVEYEDPARFDRAIYVFTHNDARNPPPEGAIVAVGSSSMKGWREDIQADLAPLTVIPRGFGGSNMNDALHFADQIVIPYKPRAVLLYEGDNDIAAGISPEEVVAKYKAFVETVHAALPETRIYFMSIKPSPRRWNVWPQMVEVNEQIAAICEKDDTLIYIDVATPMLLEDGTPKPEIFKQDRLHMERPGYEIWRDAVRPVLMEREAQYETGS